MMVGTLINVNNILYSSCTNMIYFLFYNRGIKTVQDSVKAESGKDFQLSEKFGYIHSCPTNLGTGMRASVHVDLPGWTKEGLPALQKRCEELSVQPRGTRGESGGQTGKLPIFLSMNKSSIYFMYI